MRPQKLDKKKIQNGLDCGVEVEVFESVDSTSSEARRRLSGGLMKPTLFLAEEQTAGRGRSGHRFYSPKYGGLYLTLAYPSDGFGEALLRVTAKAAVAVVSGIQSRLNLALQIKWVNDIYCGGFKVAGILTEHVPNWLLIGIGINVTTAIFPEDLIGRARSLNPLGDEDQVTKQARRALDRNELAIAVVRELLRELEHPDDTAYLERYRALSNVIGRPVFYGAYRADGTVEEQHGTAIAIEDDGALLVQKEDGTMERLDSGEIRVRTAKGEF